MNHSLGFRCNVYLWLIENNLDQGYRRARIKPILVPYYGPSPSQTNFQLISKVNYVEGPNCQSHLCHSILEGGNGSLAFYFMDEELVALRTVCWTTTSVIPEHWLYKLLGVGTQQHLESQRLTMSTIKKNTFWKALAYFYVYWEARTILFSGVYPQVSRCSNAS